MKKTLLQDVNSKRKKIWSVLVSFWSRFKTKTTTFYQVFMKRNTIWENLNCKSELMNTYLGLTWSASTTAVKIVSLNYPYAITDAVSPCLSARITVNSANFYTRLGNKLLANQYLSTTLPSNSHSKNLLQLF